MQGRIVTLLLIFGLFMAGMMNGQQANAQMPMATDSRIRTLVFGENDVYRIITRYGYQTNIEFGTGEEIMTVSLGDTVAFRITPAVNRLFIKPMEEDMETNMTVVTNLRTYQFDLSSLKSEQNDLVYVVRFYYPENDYDAKNFRRMIEHNEKASRDEEELPPPSLPEPDVAAEAPPPPASFVPPAAATQLPAPYESQAMASPPMPQAPYQPPVTQPVPPPSYNNAADTANQILLQSGQGSGSRALSRFPQVEYNYNYTLSGPEFISPVQVFDDRRVTYMRFPNSNGVVPLIFRVEPDGTEVPLTSWQQDGYVVVNGVYPRFSLRQDKNVVCLFNEAMSFASAQER
ncbi:MAG: TrbG/VirB9 family P-type conjugative transfer protein [Hyphomicrobiales bacterium]|nr:TrbG/VirB9 family P-type conjugative transfer protein [Hyphomicrobiales bacterium]